MLTRNNTQFWLDQILPRKRKEKKKKIPPEGLIAFPKSPPGWGQPPRLGRLAAALFPFHECHLVGPPAPARPAPLSQGRPGSPQVSPTGKIGRKEKQARLLVTVKAAINTRKEGRLLRRAKPIPSPHPYAVHTRTVLAEESIW